MAKQQSQKGRSLSGALSREPRPLPPGGLLGGGMGYGAGLGSAVKAPINRSGMVSIPENAMPKVDSGLGGQVPQYRASVPMQQPTWRAPAPYQKGNQPPISWRKPAPYPNQPISNLPYIYPENRAPADQANPYQQIGFQEMRQMPQGPNEFNAVAANQAAFQASTQAAQPFNSNTQPPQPGMQLQYGMTGKPIGWGFGQNQS